jgi:predicted TIM-barrel fold metal-dependent hydrolase
MMTTRRRFLQQSAAGAITAAAWPVCSGAAPSDAIPIVDTHQHLWDLERLQLPWLKPGEPLTRSFVMQDYLQAVAGLNVVQAVYMEVAAAPEQKRAEAEYILEICRRDDNPTVAAVIGGQPGLDGFREYFTPYKDSPYIKGVRHIPRDAAGAEFLYAQPAFVRDVQWLGQLGMRFDLCPPAQRLPEAIRLVDRCPETQFILDHCGNADPKAFWSEAGRAASPTSGPAAHDPQQWRGDVTELAARPNVVCKISGIVARAPKTDWTPDDLAPIVNHCLDAFGSQRVMFASDWPVCTRVASLRQWVTALQEIVAARPLEDRRRLFADNAVRVYGL